MASDDRLLELIPDHVVSHGAAQIPFRKTLSTEALIVLTLDKNVNRNIVINISNKQILYEKTVSNTKSLDAGNYVKKNLKSLLGKSLVSLAKEMLSAQSFKMEGLIVYMADDLTYYVVKLNNTFKCQPEEQDRLVEHCQTDGRSNTIPNPCLETVEKNSFANNHISNVTNSNHNNNNSSRGSTVKPSQGNSSTLDQRRVVANGASLHQELLDSGLGSNDAITNQNSGSQDGANGTSVRPFEIKREPHDTSIRPFEIKREPLDTNIRPFEIKREPLDTNIQPFEIKREPLDTNIQPFEIKREPLDTSIQPFEIKSEPHDTSIRTFEIKSEPHDTSIRPFEIKSEPHDTSIRSFKTKSKVNESSVQASEIKRAADDTCLQPSLSQKGANDQARSLNRENNASVEGCSSLIEGSHNLNQIASKVNKTSTDITPKETTKIIKTNHEISKSEKSLKWSKDASQKRLKSLIKRRDDSMNRPINNNEQSTMTGMKLATETNNTSQEVEQKVKENDGACNPQNTEASNARKQLFLPQNEPINLCTNDPTVTNINSQNVMSVDGDNSSKIRNHETITTNDSDIVNRDSPSQNSQRIDQSNTNATAGIDPEVLTTLGLEVDLHNVQSLSAIDERLEEVNNLLPASENSFNEEYYLKLGLNLIEMSQIQCKRCSTVCESFSQIEYHYSIAHQLRFTCRLCASALTTKWGLKRHINRHLEPTIVCELCSKKFYEKSELTKHMKTHSLEPKSGLTPTSSTSTTTKSPELPTQPEMTQSITANPKNGEVPTTTGKINAANPQNGEMPTTTRKINAANPKNGEVPTTTLKINPAKPKKARKKQKPCACTLSEIAFMNRAAKKGTSKRTCCDRTFTHPMQYKLHMNKHRGNKSISFMCFFCESTFSTFIEFNRHQVSHIKTVPKQEGATGQHVAANRIESSNTIQNTPIAGNSTSDSLVRSENETPIKKASTIPVNKVATSNDLLKGGTNIVPKRNIEGSHGTDSLFSQETQVDESSTPQQVETPNTFYDATMKLIQTHNIFNETTMKRIGNHKIYNEATVVNSNSRLGQNKSRNERISIMEPLRNSHFYSKVAIMNSTSNSGQQVIGVKSNEAPNAEYKHKLHSQTLNKSNPQNVSQKVVKLDSTKKHLKPKIPIKETNDHNMGGNKLPSTTSMFGQMFSGNSAPVHNAQPGNNTGYSYHRSISEIDDEPVTCGFCQVSYLSSKALERHLKENPTHKL